MVKELNFAHLEFRGRGASGWQLEQYRQCRRVQRQLEQLGDELEHEHRVPVRLALGVLLDL